MDVVSIWKALSIAVTGGFGVFGLLTEFKVKETGKLTKSGRISLWGILISTACGVGFQLKESSDDSKSKAAVADQTLSIVQSTNNSLRQLERVLSPASNPIVSMSFSIPCTDDHFGHYCRQKRQRVADQGRMVEVSDIALQPEVLPLRLNIYKNHPSREMLADSLNNDGNGDMALSVIATNYASDKSLMAMMYGGKLDLSIVRNKPITDLSNGKIASLIDFHGATLVISDLNDRLDYFTLRSLEIEFDNGRKVDVPVDRMKKFRIGKNAALGIVLD